MLNKEVQIKLYSKTGAFITTLQDTLISTSVSFDMQINSGVGRLSFNYHDDYDFNITDVIQVNDGQGRVIYRGWISNKKTSITSTGSIQTIEAQGMQTLLNSLYFPDGTVTDDPKNILEDILNVYNDTAIFRREYDFATYGSSISVEFSNDTLLSAINKVIKNQGFYLYFGLDGVVTYTPTVIKDRVGTNDGTPTGVTISNGAMVFNTSQNVAFNTGIGVQSLSVVCKFKLGADGVNSATSLMVSILNNVYLHVRGSVNTIVFRYDNTSISKSATFTLGAGNRNRVDAVGVLIDNGGTWTLQLYINGVLAQSGTYSEVPNITYGYVKGLGGNTFVGEISYNGIYNRALNATEITQIYNAGRYSPSPVRDGLIAEYYHSNIAGKVEYKDYETGTHHLVNLGNEVNAIDIDYNGQNIQNDLTIEYDGGTTTVADSTSIGLHGTYKKYIKDTSIKNLATATERGNAILQQYAYPKEQTKVILNREYDIESIKPGQTISVLNTNESVKNKTIQRIRYNIQGVELEIDEFDTIEKSVKKSLSS